MSHQSKGWFGLNAITHFIPEYPRYSHSRQKATVRPLVASSARGDALHDTPSKGNNKRCRRQSSRPYILGRAGIGESTVGVIGFTSGIPRFVPDARLAPGIGEATVGVSGLISGMVVFVTGDGATPDGAFAEGGASCCWLQPLIVIAANARHDKVLKRDFIDYLLFLQFTLYFVYLNLPQSC